jgi:hypothetical protein
MVKLFKSCSYACTILRVVRCTNIDGCAEKGEEDGCLEPDTLATTV